VIEKNPVELDLAWFVPAVGGAVFITTHCFSYLNDYVSTDGTMQAITFCPAPLWGILICYGAWGLPPLLALAGTRATDWAMLVLGGLLFTMNILDGMANSLHDGSHFVVLELLVIKLPGAVALIMSWRHIRSN